MNRRIPDTQVAFTGGVRRRGMVLIVVLVVVALMTLACSVFSDLMMAEREGAELSTRHAQARALADSGIEMVRLFLLKDPQTQEESGGWYDSPKMFRGVEVVDFNSSRQFGGLQAGVEIGVEGGSTDPGRFTIVAPALRDGVSDGIRFGLEDESTRLNLNVLALAEGGAGRELLMGLPGMTEDIADAILDWIDEDDEPRGENGAEREHYEMLEPPYTPKNGPLETVEELLLVRDVTPWLLFGCDANRNGYIDADEPSSDSLALEGDDNSDGSMDRGWAAYLTLYSLESNLNADGEPKIDLNQDDLEELYEQLDEAIGTEYATFIVAYRQNGAYTGRESGESAGGGRLDFSKEGSEKLTTVLDLIGPKTTVQFDGREEETVLESPFPDLPLAMNTYLPLLMDHTTINPSPVIPGRINLNQAPRVVLEGIPGIDEEIVNRIIAEREKNPVEAEPHRRHETWILSEGIVTLSEMKALMPFVTGGGSVYRAQVIGYFDRGGPAVRIETVLDTTAMPARMIFYRDLSHLGRGYAPQVLGIGTPDW